MKKFLALLSITAVFGVAAAGVLVGSKQANKEVKADAPSYQTYVPVSTGWLENDGGGARDDLGNWIRARNDRFWNGGSGFDSQERTFNSTDEFVDTIHRAAGGEGWMGAYRTPELELVDNNHRYITFDFGGSGESDIFINIFQVSGEAGAGDRITGIRTFFDGTGSFDESKPDNEKLNAPISCNMTFRYYELPNEIQPGDHFLIYVRDGRTSGYGGFTFGNVHINQTLDDVAKLFSVHKTQMKLNKYTSIWNSNAIDYILNFYANDSYYAAVRTAEAALVEADDGFEVNAHLSNWAYDTQFSSYGLDFNNVTSTDDAKAGFVERMPANKSGNSYFNGDVTRNEEGEKYRLVSSEFTLSGNGMISAKIGGGTAVLSLIDSSDNELITTRCAAAEGTNILNPSFVDNGVANIMDSGTRCNTMTRTYIDASAHLGKKVRVRISDDRTGGGWGLAYFDEIVTKYDSLPTLKVDKIQQQYGANPTYYGVVTDKYYGSNSTTFGKAYAFVQSFYNVLRNKTNGLNYCSLYNEQDVKDLVDDYDALESDVKALVDAAQDFDFGSAATSSNFYLTEANVTYNVGQTMAYVSDLVTNGSGSLRFDNIFASANESNFTIVLIVSFAAASLTLCCLVLYRRRKINK